MLPSTVIFEHCYAYEYQRMTVWVTRHVLYSPRLVSAILEVMKHLNDKLGFDSADLVVFVLMVFRLRKKCWITSSS